MLSIYTRFEHSMFISHIHSCMAMLQYAAFHPSEWCFVYTGSGIMEKIQKLILLYEVDGFKLKGLQR